MICNKCRLDHLVFTEFFEEEINDVTFLVTCFISNNTVAEIKQDGLMGTTVVVDQGDGLRTTYANLAAKPTVKEGDTVRTGDILGAVGDTAIAESGLAPHLHLETRMDGQPVDPAGFLDQA